MSNLDLEMVRHAGKYIACNSQQEVVATAWSEDKARTGAICKGVITPIVLYCPHLKPDLRNEVAMTRVAINAISKLKKMKGVERLYYKRQVEEVGTLLQQLLDDFERSGRNKETQQLVDQIEDEKAKTN